MDHGGDFRFRRYNRKCDFRPTSIKLTSFSRRWLNRFGQSWAHSKGTIGALNKCKRIMAATSGSGDITGNVIFRPTSIKLTSFPRFGQFWIRLKAEIWPQMKCEWIMAVTSDPGDMTEEVTYMSTLRSLVPSFFE